MKIASIYFLLCLCICSVVHGQNMVLHDPVSSRIFSVEKYSGIKGTPFLMETWIKGSVSTPKGMYNHLELKLDLYENTLYFKKDDKIYEFEDKVTGFILMPDTKDSSTYQYYLRGVAGSGIRPEQYVQILAEGKVNMYRVYNKQLSELNQINQGVVKSFSTSVKYYLLKDNNFQQIRLNRKDVLEEFEDKKQEIEEFIKTKKPDLKKESGLISLVEYYNSL